MNEEMLRMALGNYGYGRWSAQYWFIGPEQGMHEGTVDKRVEAWVSLGRQELNDCRQFHSLIGELRWHYKNPNVDLQSTWRPLMLLLMSLRGEKTDLDTLRDYQRDKLGSFKGETCLIELSGLAAKDLKTAEDTGTFLPKRIHRICHRIRAHKPKLVVMYGRTQQDSWNWIAKELTGCTFPCGDFAFELPKVKVTMYERTALVFAPHPSRPVKFDSGYLAVNKYWTTLGEKLRESVEDAS